MPECSAQTMNVILRTEKLRVEFKSREFRQSPKVALRAL